MSLLNKCDIDYKSLQDTVLPLWLNKYIEVGIEKREDVNCYTYKNIKKFELFYQDYTGNEFLNNKVLVDKVGNMVMTTQFKGSCIQFAGRLATSN